MTSFCVDLTDKALSVALASSDKVNTAVSSQLLSIKHKREEGGDVSVSYALHYPNFEGGAEPLPIDVAGENGINVKVNVCTQDEETNMCLVQICVKFIANMSCPSSPTGTCRSLVVRG